MNDEREELASLIWTTSRADESTISAMGAGIVADAILGSNWLGKHDATVRMEQSEKAALIADRRGILGRVVGRDIRASMHDHDPGGCTCGCPVPGCLPCGGSRS